MRKLLLTLAVLLSAVGFATHAQETPALPTETGEANAVNLVFQARNNANYYLGAIHLSDYAFATDDANEHIVWTVEYAGTEGQYYLKNKGLSKDGSNVYLGLNGNAAIVSSTKTAFIIALQNDDSHYYIQAPGWNTGNPNNDKALNVNGGFANNTNCPRLDLVGWAAAGDGAAVSGGDGWTMLAANSEAVTNARKADLISFCENTKTLITKFQTVEGLILAEKASDITTITNTLDASKATAENSNATDDELELAFDAAHQAKISFYATINSKTNIYLKALDGNYLYNHKSQKAGENEAPQPHAHPSENGIGFAAIWQLDPVVTGENSKTGVHIISNYRQTSTAQGGQGIGNGGAGFVNQGFTPSWYTRTVNGEEISGILFTNVDGFKFLNTDEIHANTDQTNVNREVTKSSLWDIDRVYVPKDITIEVAPAEDTPTETTDGDAETDNNSITIVNNGKKVKLTPKFVSDGTKPVTPGLTGVIWASSDANIATIQGKGELGSSYPGDTYNEINGFAYAEVTPVAAGTTTITATSPLYASGTTNTTTRVDPTGSVVLTVEPLTFTYGNPTINNEALTVTDNACDLPYSDQDRTIIVPIEKNNYTADELALSDGVNIDGDNINIAIEAKATGEKTFTITYKAPAESGSEQGGEQGEVTTETEDGETAPVLFTLKVNIAKAPLQSFTATLNESELTYSAQAQDVTVTVTPKPEAYNLKAGTMTATIAAKTTVSDPEGTETQAVETPAPVNLTKAGDDNTWTATIAANTAAGAYTITFSYSEGEGTDAIVLATATADLTIKPVEYAVVFTSDSKEVTTLAVKPNTEASVSVAFKQGETTVVTAPEVSASLKNNDDKNAEPNNPTIGTDGTISLGTLAEGSYTLTITANDATNVALTGNTLAITVTGKDVYTPVFTLADDATATVEPGKKLEVNVAFTDADKQVVSPTGEITASVEPSDKGVTAAFENGKLTITAPESIEDGEFTVTLAAAETADYKIAPETFAFSVKAPVVVKPVYTPAFTLADDATAATVEAGKSVEVPVTFTDAEGETVSDVAATATVEPATEAVKATYAEGKLTIEATAKAEAKDYKVTLAAAENAAYTIDAETTLTVTVTAAEEPAKEGTINGIEMNDATVTIADGEGSVTISGSYTVAEDGAVAPANAAAPALSASSVEGVTVTFGEVTIKDGKFSSETTIAVTDKATLPAEVTITATYTPAEGEKVSETMTLTLTAQIEGAAEDLEVSSPDKDTLPDGAVATVDGKTATVGFNASPAGDTEAVMTIDLPSAAATGTIFKESDFDISYSEDGIATATIAENGTVTITADENAAIGATTTITIKAMPNNGSNDDQTGDTQAYLANETSNDTDDAILTINVTIYGVEFTKAPSTATLGMDNTVNVTFETNACVPAAKEDAPEESSDETEAAEEEAPAVTLSVDGEGAEVDNKTGVITFTKAGKYTVTAKAGDNYAATTEITVKEAPTVTGIEAVNADAAAGNATVYDLQGRRINRVNAAGIYIVNGVKTLVR